MHFTLPIPITDNGIKHLRNTNDSSFTADYVSAMSLTMSVPCCKRLNVECHLYRSFHAHVNAEIEYILGACWDNKNNKYERRIEPFHFLL